jgi:5-(carboxyamino)imidazole ribonucleotide synthase
MRIGILGSGQLGRMLALAGYNLGHTFCFYDENFGAPTQALGPTTVAPFDDRAALRSFAEQCDVITYEFENVPCEAAHLLNQLVPVYPPPRALEVSQDRLIEKEFLQSLQIGTPRFRAADSEEELRSACLALGLPCIAKTRRFGYDGKGQYRIENEADIPAAWKALHGAPVIVEGFVPFSRELSVIATRDVHGAIEVFPLAENHHKNGILHRTEIPAPDSTPDLRASAHELISKVLVELQYVGTLTIELFDIRGELLANEMAPRVHNSGHPTIDSTITSQFENHIRAITGAPLGAVEPKARAVMFNLIGTTPPESSVLEIPNAKLHLYGKSPRAGRKLGHVTLLNPSITEEDSVESLTGR